MHMTLDVSCDVALAAVLDSAWLAPVLVDDELLDDVALWGAGSEHGATDVLASHPTVQHLAMEAVLSPRAQVRATVAARRDLDVALYALLATDDDTLVRAQVASNPGVPRAVIDRLSADDDDHVQALAATELERRTTGSSRERVARLASYLLSPTTERPRRDIVP